MEKLFEMVKSSAGDDADKLCQMLDELDLKDELDEVQDEQGMTLLMHAVWKGKIDTANMLLRRGSSVNGGNHEHGYSALHFAALANRAEMCRLLIERGADTQARNSVNRTPSQMAAFVGNTECVVAINSYVSKEDVYYYTRKQPLEKEPKLPLQLAKPLHHLVLTTNIHPVRLALVLKSDEASLLLSHLEKTSSILEMMSKREFVEKRDVNEILALKFHIIHYVVRDIYKQTLRESSSQQSKNLPLIDRWIKSMLMCGKGKSSPFHDDFMRQAVKEFPYKEATIFKTLVTTMAQQRDTFAVALIMAAINGHPGFRDGNDCSTCGQEKAPKACTACKAVYYCDRTCQKIHWFMHKYQCASIQSSMEAGGGQERVINGETNGH